MYMNVFLLELKRRNIPDYLFIQYSLKIRSINLYNLYWKSHKRTSRISELVQRMINYDTTQTKQYKMCIIICQVLVHMQDHGKYMKF